MSQFIFNGSSRMRNVTFARDHHKTRTSILEDAQRQRLRREEEARRTRAAQRLQRVIRQWLAGVRVMRLALENVRSLPSDVSRFLCFSSVSDAAESSSSVEEQLTKRLHTACWSLSYAVTHPSRIPVNGPPVPDESVGKEEEESVQAEASKATAPASYKCLTELQAHHQRLLHQYGSTLCTVLGSCALWTPSRRSETVDTPSPLWQHLLSSLSTKDVSLLLYVLLQQLPHATRRSKGKTASSVVDAPTNDNGGVEQLFSTLTESVVRAIIVRNAAYSRSLNEEGGVGTSTMCYCLLPSSLAYVDRWPAIQALTMALDLATQEPALSQAWIRKEYTEVLRPLLSSFPIPPSSLPPAATAAASSPQATESSAPSPLSLSSSAFARACWQCMCATFSDDAYLLLTTNPLVVLLSAEETEPFNSAPAPDGDGGSASLGADACCTLLIEECFLRTALTTQLTSGEDVSGIKGGPLRARVLGRLVRLLPHVQQWAKSTAPHAADALKRYLLSVSCLSERLCREPFFVESILADHYAYNTGQKHATLADAATITTATATAAHGLHRSQYRLLSSYLFSTEGGLHLMQLLTAADEAREQLRLQTAQKPNLETSSDASAPLADAVPVGGKASRNGAAAAPDSALSAASPFRPHTMPPATAASSTAAAGATSGPATVWPTSASAQQSPLEILCNVFAWPLFTFSKPDYGRYQQETLALSAKLVRTPQLLRRLWSLYWQSCEGLRAVLPPTAEFQKLCARPVWGEGEMAAASAPRLREGFRERRVPGATATTPVETSLLRLPTWETHPRYPMSFYDPHPSLSVFFFTLLAHYVNVCDFADGLRRGGDTAVFSVEEACALILALKEIVHRAHLYGVVPDSNGEAVAHTAGLLLSRLHVVNEADPFVPAGVAGLWVSVSRVAADSAVASIVTRWDEASAAVVDEERAAVEEDVAAGEYASPTVTAAAASGYNRRLDSTSSPSAGAVVLSRLPGDDLMFHGSQSWDTKLRYIKLLLHAPFLLPFSARALLLSALLASQEDQWVPPADRPAVVHRGRVFVDAFDLFHTNPMSSNVYNIRFVSEDGTLEAGYGRGVYRECIVSLCKEGFAAEYGLFRQTTDGYVFPNSFSAIAAGDPQHLQKIRFLGAMVGRALRDGVLQDVPFAQHFRNAILGRRNTLSNLKSFDSELYHQLMSLTLLDEQELQAIGLTFVYTVNSLGVTKEVELVRGGAQMEVTPRNCLYYVHLVADFKLNREAADQTRAFCAGLHSVLDSNRLVFFDSNEVGKLFGGDESGGIDLQDWKANTVYDSADDAEKPQVRLFWDVVESLTRKQQSQLLKFATSMTRPPLLGFSFLSPPFKLQLLSPNVSGGDHLPSAATCFSTLKLPPYGDYATARAKIIAAIEETGTFEYS